MVDIIDPSAVPIVVEIYDAPQTNVCWHCLWHAGPGALIKLNLHGDPERWGLVDADTTCSFCWLFIPALDVS